MHKKSLLNSFLLFIFFSSLPILGEARTCINTLSTIPQVRAAIADFAAGNDDERVIRPNGHEKWSIDGTHKSTSHNSYNNQFAGAVAEQSLEHWATNRRREGKSSHVLDLFGSCLFSRLPWVFDSLTGVRVRPIEEEQISLDYAGANWQEVIGDLFEHSSWSKLDDNARSREIPPYDMIIVRPFGPLLRTSGNSIRNGRAAGFFGAAHTILDRAWQRLSDDEGVMLIEIFPVIANSPEFKAWLNRLKAANIEYVQGTKRSLKLIRRRESSAQLPK